MKNLFHALLIALLVWPTLVPWLPHSAAHAVHETHRSHRAADADHGPVHGPVAHGEHDHARSDGNAPHHDLILSAADYLHDYLDTDLGNPEGRRLDATAKAGETPEYTPPGPSLQERFAGLTARGPPDFSPSALSRLPVYLSTRRLRI